MLLFHMLILLWCPNLLNPSMIKLRDNGWKTLKPGAKMHLSHSLTYLLCTLVPTTDSWFKIEKMKLTIYAITMSSLACIIYKLLCLNLAHLTMLSPSLCLKSGNAHSNFFLKAGHGMLFNPIIWKVEAEGSGRILSPSYKVILRPVWAPWYYLKNLQTN